MMNCRDTTLNRRQIKCCVARSSFRNTWKALCNVPITAGIAFDRQTCYYFSLVGAIIYGTPSQGAVSTNNILRRSL